MSIELILIQETKVREFPYIGALNGRVYLVLDEGQYMQLRDGMHVGPGHIYAYDNSKIHFEFVPRAQVIITNSNK